MGVTGPVGVLLAMRVEGVGINASSFTTAMMVSSKSALSPLSGELKLGPERDSSCTSDVWRDVEDCLQLLIHSSRSSLWMSYQWKSYLLTSCG